MSTHYQLTKLFDVLERISKGFAEIDVENKHWLRDESLGRHLTKMKTYSDLLSGFILAHKRSRFFAKF